MDDPLAMSFVAWLAVSAAILAGAVIIALF